MGDRFKQYDQFAGFLIPDERLTFANVDSGQSSYTQGSPIAAPPTASQETDLSLRVTGANSSEQTIEVQTQTGGIPVRNGAGYVWRDKGSTAWYGADHLGLVTGHEVLSTTAPGGAADCARADGGRVVSVTRPKTASGTVVRSYFDSSSDSWTSASLTVSGYTFGTGSSPGLEVAPDGRVFMFLQSDRSVNKYRNIDILVSENNGTSWSVYARRVVDDNVSSDDDLRIRAAITDGGVLLALGTTSGAVQKVKTYAATTPAGPYRVVSADVGAELTINAGGGSTDTHDVTRTRDGSVLLVTRHTDSASAKAWVSVALPSVSTPVANGTQRQIKSTDLTPDVPTYANKPGAAVWLGEDGDLYSLCTKSEGSGVHSSELLRKSKDGGASWTLWHGSNIDLRGTTSEYFTGYGAADMGGRLFVVGKDQDETATRAVYMGGHSTQTFPRGYHILGSSYFAADAHVTYSPVTDIDSDQLQGALYMPHALPADMGWTRDTSAGTPADALASGYLSLSGSGDLTFKHTAAKDSAYQGIVAEIELKVTTLTAKDTGIRVQLSNCSPSGSDATYVYICNIKAGTGGYEVIDASDSSPVGDPVAYDMTEFTVIRVAIDKAGNVKTWHCSNGQRRSWSEGPAGPLSSYHATAPDASTLVTWGKLDNSSQESTWSHVGWCGWPDVSTRYSTGTPAESYSNPDDVRPLDFSPIPQHVRKGIELSAIDGPTIPGDQWTCAPGYSYPLEAMHHEVSPGPAVTYRSSSDAADQIIAWKLSGSGARLRNTSIGLCLLRCNFKTADLDTSTDNGASWTTAGTINLGQGLESLSFKREGTALVVDTGTAQAADRYIWPDEFRGASVKLIGGSTVVRRIKGNSGGSWTDATSRRPVFELDSVDGTEPTSGTCEIWARSGVLVVHEVTDAPTHVRLKIHSGTTPDGYQEVGQALIGDLFVFGNSPSFGRTITTEQRGELSQDSSGVTYGRRSGLPSREVSISWDEGMPTRRLYRDTIKPDYVAGTDAGEAIANRGDVVLALESLTSQRLGGVAHPVVYLGRIDRGSGSKVITDRQLVIYGRVTSDPSVEPFQGDEGRDEVIRSGRVTVAEIPGGWEAP